MSVKQSINNVQVIGTLKEMNIQEATVDNVELRNSDGVKKTVTCQQIQKAKFSSPMFLIESNGYDIGVDWFPTNEKMLDDDGKIVDNPKFKAMKTVMETYVTKAKDADNATRVFVRGSLRPQEYVGKDGGWKSYPSISGYQISSSNVPSEDSTDSEISGYIKSIIPETRGENAEETGRYKVELYSFDYSGKTIPTTFIVEEDLADDFTSYYENNQSVKIYYEILVKQVGARNTQSTGGFGRRSANIVSGFSVTEYSIFRGEEPFDEENEYYISVEDMNSALEERDIMIEKKIKESKDKSSSTNSSTIPRGTTQTNKANPFGGGNNSASGTTEKKRNPFG